MTFCQQHVAKNIFYIVRDVTCTLSVLKSAIFAFEILSKQNGIASVRIYYKVDESLRKM